MLFVLGLAQNFSGSVLVGSGDPTGHWGLNMSWHVQDTHSPHCITSSAQEPL